MPPLPPLEKSLNLTNKSEKWEKQPLLMLEHICLYITIQTMILRISKMKWLITLQLRTNTARITAQLVFC